MNSNQWCTIESDPAVFTELISKLGVPSVQVEEIYSLEDTHQLQILKPIYGLIFLFKWAKDTVPRQTLDIYDNDLFFAKQIINNACATQAIVSVLLNSPVKIEGALKEFCEFSKQLSSEDKGLALGNSESIRKIHNDFKQPEAIVHHENKNTKKADAFHFISYVPVKGTVYQLDGLRNGPINLGAYESYDDWLSVAKKAIQQRIHYYQGKQIRFTLLAVCENLRTKAENRLIQLRKEKLSALLRLQASNYAGQINNQIKQLKQQFPDVQAKEGELDQQALVLDTERLNSEIQMFNLQVHEEQEKAITQRNQNIRRKHNYIPLIIEMLKIAAKKGKIEEFIQPKEKKG